jgi:hypothetical protein
MAFVKDPSKIKRSIIGFVKHLLSRQKVQDIDTLLTPCCIPILTGGDVTGCSGGDTSFDDFVVSTSYRNKNATLLFSFWQPDRDTFITAVNVTLDENGAWTGDVIMYSFVAEGEATVTVGVIVEGSQVVVTSAPITITGISNCD